MECRSADRSEALRHIHDFKIRCSVKQGIGDVVDVQPFLRILIIENDPADIRDDRARNGSIFIHIAVADYGEGAVIGEHTGNVRAEIILRVTA